MGGGGDASDSNCVSRISDGICARAQAAVALAESSSVALAVRPHACRLTQYPSFPPSLAYTLPPCPPPTPLPPPLPPLGALQRVG